MVATAIETVDDALRASRPWRPKRVLATRSAREWAHGRAMLERDGFTWRRP